MAGPRRDYYPIINGKRTHIRANTQQDLANKILARCGNTMETEGTRESVSITDFAADWLARKQNAPEKKRIRQTTAAEYQRQVRYIRSFFRSLPIHAVSTVQVQRFADWMAFGTQNGLKRNCTEMTIERTLGTLKQMMKEAVDVYELMPKIPYKAELIVNRGKPSRHHKALPPAVYQAVREAVPQLSDPKEKMFMALLITTGMRPEEIYGLRWEDVADDWSYLQIRRAVTYPHKNLPVISEPKTPRSNRFVNLMDWVRDILQLYAQPEGFVLGGEHPLGYSTRGRMQRNAWKNTGLEGKNICPYDFRANFATMLCESGQSDKQVADLMGHADTRMVDHIYAPARKEGILQHKDACEKLFG